MSDDFYTMVDSGLTYDNYVIGEQFALEGLSDSANLVGFYENDHWSVRAAYIWRDEFLAGRFDGTGLPNPSAAYLDSGAITAIGYWDPQKAGMAMNAVAKILNP